MRNILFGLLLLLSAGAQGIDKKDWKWLKTDKKDCKYYAQSTPNDVSHATWTGGCKDGKADGEGVLTVYAKKTSKQAKLSIEYTYTGTLTLGKLTGKGELVYNKRIDKGIFEEGELINGSKESPYYGYLEGELKNGELNGKGFRIARDSVMYIGLFKRNNLIGEGMVIYPDGDTLQGTFSEYGDVFQPEYIYKVDGSIFKGKHYESASGYKPAQGEVYLDGVVIAKVVDGKRMAIDAGIPIDGGLYYGSRKPGAYSKLLPHDSGKIIFDNKDTLHAIFDKGEIEKVISYTTVDGYRFEGEYKNYNPYSGKLYRGSTPVYEVMWGERREIQMSETNASINTPPETNTDPYANYATGKLLYKGISDYDLIVEVEAEARYSVKKAPGVLSFDYIDVAEAKGVRFRYPENSSTWHSFSGDANIYRCKQGYDCISIQGMVFRLSSPVIP